MGEIPKTQYPEAPSPAPEEPFPWKISDEKWRMMTPEERDLYLNEKLNRIYDALMLQAEGHESGDEVMPEDIIATLHPEREQEFERIRNRDLPEH